MNAARLNRMYRATFALFAGTAALFWNGSGPGSAAGLLISTAEARIGRPATPMSYAGVARRTTRRAVAVGAAGAAATGAYYYRPGCVQVVNSYGQIVYQCP
jgi:hypothetical protein